MENTEKFNAETVDCGAGAQGKENTL